VTKVGLMLYTIRDECARDFEGSLRRVADVGYDGVELFDLHGRDAADVRALLDELGLEVAGRHVSADADLEQVAVEMRVLGSDRIALAWIDPPDSADASHAAVELVRDRAAQAAALGLRYGFHNHWAELERFDGATTLERIAELPVWLELDLGWAWWAGEDPIELLRRYEGRTPLVHVKDIRERGGRDFAPVGEGGVGYDRVLPAASVEWLIVEQDETDGDPFEAVAQSLEFTRGALSGVGA
jgi:sugar phosphate isomerase/epimerase